MPVPFEYETGDTDNPWVEGRWTSPFLLSQMQILPAADIRGGGFVVHVSRWNWMTFSHHKQRVFPFWMPKNSLKFGVAPIPLQLKRCPNRSCRGVRGEPCFYESVAICLPSWALRIRGRNSSCISAPILPNPFSSIVCVFLWDSGMRCGNITCCHREQHPRLSFAHLTFKNICCRRKVSRCNSAGFLRYFSLEWTLAASRSDPQGWLSESVAMIQPLHWPSCWQSSVCNLFHELYSDNSLWRGRLGYTLQCYCSTLVNLLSLCKIHSAKSSNESTLSYLFLLFFFLNMFNLSQHWGKWPKVVQETKHHWLCQVIITSGLIFKNISLWSGVVSGIYCIL